MKPMAKTAAQTQNAQSPKKNKIFIPCRSYHAPPITPKHMKTTLFLLCFFPLFLRAQTFILDADTGNEMDDLYAIVRAVADPQVKLLALSSAHFNNAGMATDKMWNCHNIRKKSSVQISQDLNEDLLKHLGRMDIPHPLGGLRMIGKPWGGSEPSPSAASAFIRNAVKNLNPGEKLNVVSIGASSLPLPANCAAICSVPAIFPIKMPGTKANSTSAMTSMLLIFCSTTRR
jgi:hypothetical protein